MRLRGWCFIPGKQIKTVEVLFPTVATPVPLASYGLPSPDVAKAVSLDAHHVRFDEWVPLPQAQQGRDFTLLLRLADGSVCATSSVRENASADGWLSKSLAPLSGGAEVL
ncbi:MAG: hypothetical protein PHQ04_02140 [Opitutaceae bacterium]|nr:hypothetical protein [Opitutaceae bacterium]